MSETLRELRMYVAVLPKQGTLCADLTRFADHLERTEKRIQDWREWVLRQMDAPDSLELHRSYDDVRLRNEFGGQIIALAGRELDGLLATAKTLFEREQEKVAAWKKSANNWATAFDGFAAAIQENNPALAKALRDVGLEMRVDRGS